MFGGGGLNTGLGGGIGQENINSNNDYEVPGAPDDGISCLDMAINSTANPQQPVQLMAAGSWDSTVRVWQLNVAIQPASGFNSQPQQAIQAQPICQFRCQAPVLSCSFNQDGSVLFTGDCANNVTMFNLQVGWV